MINCLNKYMAAGLKEQGLKKKVIVLGLEDVLVPGKVVKKVNGKEVEKILKNLKKLHKKIPRFQYFLVSGLREKQAKKLAKKYNLDKYFEEQNMYFVTEKYIWEKKEIDKKLYMQNIEKNERFKDEFFKQYVIDLLEKELKIGKHEMLYIGHDVWSEGFYTHRFSKIDFALIKSSYSHLDEKKEFLVKGLTYIERKWKDVKKLIEGKNPKPDYSGLEKFVYNTMKEALFKGTKMEGISKIAK